MATKKELNKILKEANNLTVTIIQNVNSLIDFYNSYKLTKSEHDLVMIHFYLSQVPEKIKIIFERRIKNARL